MLNTVKHQAGARPMRFRVGVADSVPKLIAYEIIRPVFHLRPPVHMVCREGKVGALLSLLAAQRLDIVLADEPASSALQLKNFNHPLGTSDVTFCAAASLAASCAKASRIPCTARPRFSRRRTPPSAARSKPGLIPKASGRG